jgi:DNA-binding transcriptional LysR family regulator
MRRLQEKTFYKQNRLKQLRAFCVAAETGSFSKAAELLELTQPSISSQIQSLEKDMGVILFHRNGPKISLTEMGKELLPIAQPLVDQIDSLPSVFASRLHQQGATELNISAGEATILYILPSIIEKFKKAHPNVTIKLHNETGKNSLNLLRENRAEFAVGTIRDIPGDIQYRGIYNFAPVLILPYGHPLASEKNISLNQISKYELIIPPPHFSTWTIVESVFNEHNIPYKVSLEAGSWEVIKKYVELGLGISIVTSVCLTGSERLVTCPLPGFFLDRNYGVLLLKGKTLTPAARHFIELMDPSFFHTPTVLS